jgi:hypothetical protein
LEAEMQTIYPKGTYQLQLFCQAESVCLYDISNLKTKLGFQSTSFWKIIKSIENDICVNKFPQNSNKYRKWDNHIYLEHIEYPRIKAELESITMQQGFHLHKFIIRIISFQNLTWQGTVQCLGVRTTLIFKSLNELLRIIDNAVLNQAEIIDIVY